MNVQKKVKLTIVFAIVLIITLFAISIAQIVFITKAKNEIRQQQEQIKQLDEKLAKYEQQNINGSIIIGEVEW